MSIAMNLCLFLLLITAQLFTQMEPVERVPLIREGSKITEATGMLATEKDTGALVFQLEKDDEIVNTMIVLPNQRLAEMESATAKKTESRFRISGEVYSFENRNYLLVKEAVSLEKHAQRNHPTTAPIDPNKTTIEREDFEDSISDIVQDLEEATGSLVRSIRSAAENPINNPTQRVEGFRITARRCHLVRNEQGAWIAVFVSDATGLSDPPCTVLPGKKFSGLINYIRNVNVNDATPVLLTGEILNYHGHHFLALAGWRTVHRTPHLP